MRQSQRGLSAHSTLTDPRLDHAEESCRKHCQLLESGVIKQAAILFFRSLKASGAAEHIQVAHRLLPVFVADARELRHLFVRPATISRSPAAPGGNFQEFSGRAHRSNRE
jgi:hypothetical protein